MGAAERQRTTSYLAIQLGSAERQIIVWDTVDITVGRSDSQDIVVPEPEVSREHAVFRRRGEVCEVEDLKSGLGTIVDGKAIKVHGLRNGNVIRIGTLEIEFGQSREPIARTANVCFASELKEFGLTALEDGAGRTMLGFDSEDDLLPPRRSASASSSASAPRAVNEDGTIETGIENTETLDLGAEPIAVRNLDEEIPTLDESAIARELALSAASRSSSGGSAGQSRQSAEAKTPLAPLGTPASGARSQAVGNELTAKLVLEITGPAAEVEAFLQAIRDKRIQVPPIELLVRDI